MGHFLLTTVGTVGDVAPFIILGSALRRRGHQVMMVTHCAHQAACEQAGLGFVALDTPAEFEGFIKDGHLLNTGPGISQFLRRYVIPSIPAHVDLMQAKCTPETIVVARSTPSIAPRLVAEKLRLPFVSVLMSPHHLTAATTVSALLETAFSFDINTIRTRMALPGVHDWHAWWQAASLSVGLWPAWFSPLPALQEAMEIVLAGFLWRDVPGDENLSPALAGNLAPILVTGGTGMFGGKDFYQVCADACAALALPTILLTRIPQLVPGNLAENVRWIEYIPQPELGLPYRQLIIHHGGMGTLSDALAAGIPQVILAAGGDRPENAQHAVRLGVAEFLPRPRWQVDVLIDAIQRMLASAVVGQRCRQVAGWLRQADAAAAACDALESVIASRKPYSPGGMLAGEFTQALPGSGEIIPAPKNRLQLAGLTPQEQALLAARLRQKKQAQEKK